MGALGGRQGLAAFLAAGCRTRRARQAAQPEGLVLSGLTEVWSWVLQDTPAEVNDTIKPYRFAWFAWSLGEPSRWAKPLVGSPLATYELSINCLSVLAKTLG